ncbi:MAG: hypothetical protein U0163_14240 [Gemmatimonadaceae bacterium]
MSRIQSIAVAAIVTFAVACQSDAPSIAAPVGSGAVPTTTGDAGLAAAHGPLFQGASAPAIANPVVSFWAKKGTKSEVFMYYAALPGRTDSVVFVRFRIPKNGLLKYPNGQPFQSGDSVLITLTLIDNTHLAIDCQPTGLQFNPASPAALKLSYLDSDPDIDQDGDVDATDLALQAQVRIWMKDPGTPWTRLVGNNDQNLHEVESSILGFIERRAGALSRAGRYDDGGQVTAPASWLEDPLGPESTTAAATPDRPRRLTSGNEARQSRRQHQDGR